MVEKISEGDLKQPQIAGSWIAEVFEQSTLGIVQVNAGGRIVYANKKARELCGYADLVGKELNQLYPDANNYEIIQHQLSARRRGLSDEYGVELTSEDGRKVPVSVSAMPIIAESNEFVGSIGIFRSRELEQARQALDVVINSAVDSKQLLDQMTACMRHHLEFDLLRVSLYSRDSQHAMVIYQSPEEGDAPSPIRWFAISQSVRSLVEEIQPSKHHLPDFHDQLGVQPLLDTGMQWSMRFPIRRENHTAGAVSVFTKRREGYTAREFELFCGLPLDNALAAALFFESRQELQFTLELAKTIANCKTEIEIFEMLARELVRNYRWSHASVFTPDVIGGRIILRSQAGAPQYLLPKDYSQPMGQGLLGWVFQHGQDAYVSDFETDASFQRVAINIPGRGPVRSELCMRICAAREVYALLNVEDRQANVLSTEEREQLRRLLDEFGEIIQQRRRDNLVNAAFNATPTAVLLIDEKGKIRDTNPAGSQLLQLDNRQLIGTSIADYIESQDTVEAIANGGTPVSEVEFIGAQKNRVKGILAVMPLEGTLNLRMLAFRDTGAQRRAQELDALTGVYAELARQVKPELSIIGACLREIRQQLPLSLVDRLWALLGRPTILDDVPGLMENITRNLRQLEAKFDKIILLGHVGDLPKPERIVLFLPNYIDDLLDEIPLNNPDDIEREISDSYVRADPGQLTVVIQTILSYFLRFRRRDQPVVFKAIACGAEVTFSVKGGCSPAPSHYQASQDIDNARATLDLEMGRTYLDKIVTDHEGRFLDPLFNDGQMMLRFTLPAFQGTTL